MHVSVDYHDGCKTATPEAAHGLKGEFSVRCCGIDANPQLLFEFGHYVVTTSQVACRSEADLDDVATGLLRLEKVVERDYAVDFGERDF